MLQGPIAYLALYMVYKLTSTVRVWSMDRYGLMDRVRTTGSIILRIWKLEPSGGGVWIVCIVHVKLHTGIKTLWLLQT